jgi:DNA primase
LRGFDLPGSVLIDGSASDKNAGMGAIGVSGPTDSGRNDFKAQVLSTVDIVDVIGRTVSLKRRGKDFVGLCPFHQEKTPSFHVSPSRQFFHCFGCRASGNAIDFVIKRDRVEFIDALRALGQSVGLEMPRSGASKEKAGQRQQLLEACSQACALFEKLLSDEEIGRSARSYLAQRGFDAQSIKRFQIGFAPDSWDTVLKSAMARKFGPEMLQQAGLIKPRQSGDGHYDTFRNRVIFPIRDENARVIAFGGRVMPGSEDPAKYLNSPETPLFSKGRSIFGLDLARQRIVETRTVAVVEGYTDVVMAHQFGASNVVSILGTAMTEQHVTMLRRFADKIVLLFDADTAGESAVNRTVELFMTQPVDFAIASMPEGVDPDEFLLAHGVEAFDRLLNEAPSVLSFLERQFQRRWDANEQSIPERERAMQVFMEPFLRARAERAIDDTRWGAVLGRLSKATGMAIGDLNRKYGQIVRKSARRIAQAAQEREPTKDAPDASSAELPKRGRRIPTAQDTAERHLLGILLCEPDRWHRLIGQVDVSDFTDALHRALAEAYWAHQRDEGEPVFNEFLSQLTSDEQRGLAVELVEEVEALPEMEESLLGALLHFSQERDRRETQKHTARLHRSDEKQPGEDPLGEQDEISLLLKLQEQARRSDMRRVGS